MSKIYEALRRHDREISRPAQEPLRDLPAHELPLQESPVAPRAIAPRAEITRALEPVYPAVYRLMKESGRGFILHFVSASPGEGTSTLSVEFARVAARDLDSKVLLVDADRVKPTTATGFGCPTNVGLIDTLQTGPALDLTMIRSPDNAHFQVGALCGRQSQPLSGKKVAALYEQLRARYQLTILDCPAVFSDRYFDLSPDAADGIVLIVQAERSRPEMIRRAKSLIENIGGKLVGAILNRRQVYIPDFIYRLL
jgi:protein-tyrosine kinase